MKRKLILFLTLLFSCIVLSATTMVYADESGKETLGVFQLGFYADDSLSDSQKKMDLSGIKVDVYKSELTNFDGEFNISEFTHNYAFSVYTDANGGVQFVRPSKEMLILVDVSTLPRNAGIAISTKFYRNDITQDKLAISKVERVVIEKTENSEDDFYVNAYNKEGSRINVDYTLSEKSSVTSENEKIVCMEACVGDITEKREYILSCYEKKESEAFCEECAGILPVQEINSKRNQLSIPLGLEKSEVFGPFMIHYSSSTDTVPTFISSLGLAFQAADASLGGGLSLLRPIGHEADAKYHIYVTDESMEGNSNAVGACFPLINSAGVKMSYIVIYKVEDLSKEATLIEKGTAAHEYMHAITYRYNNLESVPLWFAEAWANWAAVRVQGIESRNVDDVNEFLSNTDKVFKTDEYKYGKFLLPLFIGQNYGDNTVANAIKNLATATNVEVAISNALPSGVTFQSIFPDFMGFNYAPKYFYTTYASRWNNRPYISANYALNAYPNDDYRGVINSYSANYIEFFVPQTTPYNLDITVRAVNSTGSLAGKLQMNGSNNVITFWNFSPQGSFVTYSTTIGVLYSKGGMSITNKGNGSTGYFLTIERS